MGNISIGPTVRQLSEQAATRSSRRVAQFYSNPGAAITLNSTSNITLLDTDLRDVDFSSTPIINFSCRTGILVASSSASEEMVIECCAIRGGVTTAFTRVISFSPATGLTHTVQTKSMTAHTHGFIHTPGTPVTYRLRGRIENRVNLSINVRQFGMTIEWIPEVATR